MRVNLISTAVGGGSWTVVFTAADYNFKGNEAQVTLHGGQNAVFGV